MSVQSRSPLSLKGASINSGFANTGEQRFTRGGELTATIFSGQVAPGLTGAPGAVAAGSDVLICSGAGRLNTIIPHNVMQSGIPVYFYDAGVAISGGPLAASGHRIVGVLPATYNGAQNVGTTPASGAAGWAMLGMTSTAPIVVDMPFLSGLCLNSRSGQPGFTVSYTPETT